MNEFFKEVILLKVLGTTTNVKRFRGEEGNLLHPHLQNPKPGDFLRQDDSVLSLKSKPISTA